MGFRAADVPAQRGRPPEGTRIDGREANGVQWKELLDRREALQAAGAPREQAAFSLLRTGRIDGDVHRDAIALARSRGAGPAQDAYDRVRQLGDVSATARAREDRNRATATEPSDLDVARALAELLPARALRRPPLTDRDALAAQAVEWEARRLRRCDERERERLIEVFETVRTAIADLAQPAVLRELTPRSFLPSSFLRR